MEAHNSDQGRFCLVLEVCTRAHNLAHGTLKTVSLESSQLFGARQQTRRRRYISSQWICLTMAVWGLCVSVLEEVVGMLGITLGKCNSLFRGDEPLCQLH